MDRTLDFEKLAKTWFQEIQSLRNTMPISLAMVAHFFNESSNKLQTFINTKCETVQGETNDEVSYNVPKDEFYNYKRLKNEIGSYETASKILPRMFIVTLVCQYDAFIGNLMRLVLREHSGMIEDRAVSFKELMLQTSIDDVKEIVISKEIEIQLRENHNKQLEWFERKLNIKLHEDKNLLSNFFEITERRNLFTHNNGVVNESYIKNCRSNNCKITAKSGDILDVSPEYYRNSVDCILEIGAKLILIVWRCVMPSEHEKTELIVNNFAYELICDGHYSLAEKFINFALVCYKPFVSGKVKLMLNVNLAQCYYWQGKFDKTKELLNKQDWSLCGSQFLVCKAVLEKNYATALQLLKKENTELSKGDLLEWPIFEDFRKDELFKEYFKEMYSINTDELDREIANKAQVEDR